MDTVMNLVERPSHEHNGHRDLDISVVIPVYRSAGMLEELTNRLHAVMQRMDAEYEIVFVDDASPDDSWKRICLLRDAAPDRIVAVQLMRNFGQHNAIMCGFRHASGRYVVTMDDDLQHPPEEIPKLVDTIEQEGHDLVYGRYQEKQHASGRNWGSLIVNAFFRLVFKQPVTVTSFRIIRQELLRSIFSYSLNFTYIDGLLAWNTQRIGEANVDHQPRQVGRSGYSLGKLVTLAFNLFTNFSLLPLQIVSLIGFVAALGGFAMGAFYLIQHLLSNIVVPGYASIIVAVLVLGGTQLLSLGIIGEYIGRLHLNVNRKPQYTIRCTLPAERTSVIEPIDGLRIDANGEPIR